MKERLSYQDYRDRISIIDVAKQLGYSDKTPWAKEKKSRLNPCFQSPAGEKIIISHPGDNSIQLYFNPENSLDKGDLITFVQKKLNLDPKGVNEYLSGFLNNIPLIRRESKEVYSATPKEQSFKAHYFNFSPLSQQNSEILNGRGINNESINSKAFRGFFHDVQIPIFHNGKMVSFSKEKYIGVKYYESLTGGITGVDYRNGNIKKHGITSKKSTSVGLSNIPDVLKEIFIAESGIDAISHYQLTQPGDDVLYFITGGNLTLGQILAVDSITEKLSNNQSVVTTLLFDNDVSGNLYDLKIIAHQLNKLIHDDIINLEQDKNSIIIEIFTDQLPEKLCKKLLSFEHITGLSVLRKESNIFIPIPKDSNIINKVSNEIINLFSLTETLNIQKSEGFKDWNAKLQDSLNTQATTYFHGTAYLIDEKVSIDVNINRGVGSNAFTLGNGIYMTDNISAALLFSHLSVQNKLFREEAIESDSLKKNSLENAGTGNIYQISVDPEAKILDASLPLDPSAVRSLLNQYKVPDSIIEKRSDMELSDIRIATQLFSTVLEFNQNPYQYLVTGLNYDGILIQESRWETWDYYPKTLGIDFYDFSIKPQSLVMYNDDKILKPKLISSTINDSEVLKHVSSIATSFIDTIRMRKEDEVKPQLMYDTEEKRIKSLRKKGNIITFLQPYQWKGESFSQILITGVSKTKDGHVRLEGSNRDTPWYKNMGELINMVDWEFMEKNHNEKFHINSTNAITFSLKEIAKDINELFGNKLSYEECEKYIEKLYDRFKNNLSDTSKQLFHNIINSRYELLINPLQELNTKLGFNSEIFNVYRENEIRKVKLIATGQLINNVVQNIADFGNDQRQTGLNQLQKINQMDTKNAGEQTQKSQSERLEGFMKILGMSDIWKQVAADFQKWADCDETGRKSFTVDNLTFRRTGYKSDEKNIDTSMLASVTLNFNKNEKGTFFNSFTPELKNSISESIKTPKAAKYTFEISLKKEDAHNNPTIKEALNLLDGRSVNIKDNNWAKLVAGKIEEYKFDLTKAIQENKHINFSSTSPEHMENAVKALMKGDFALISCEIDQKNVTVFLTADAQYKKVQAHDNNLYRHLSTEEKKSIDERMTTKQDQAQGNGMHP